MRRGAYTVLPCRQTSLYFGCNVQDFDTEQGVLNEVGSYGSQLNRVVVCCQSWYRGISTSSG